MDAISNQAEAEERLKLNGNANEEFCQSAVRIKEGPKARLRQWILAIIGKLQFSECKFNIQNR